MLISHPVQLVSPGTFLVGVLKKGQVYSFSMCNPPFYEDENDLHGNCSQRDEDRPSPSSINTGQAHETMTPGGEVAFVKNLIDDSLALGDQVRYVTLTECCLSLRVASLSIGYQ